MRSQYGRYCLESSGAGPFASGTRSPRPVAGHPGAGAPLAGGQTLSELGELFAQFGGHVVAEPAVVVFQLG
jgi:hypothetical protein